MVALIEFDKIADMVGKNPKTIRNKCHIAGILAFTLTTCNGKRHYLRKEDAEKILASYQVKTKLNADLTLNDCVFYDEFPSIFSRPINTMQEYVRRANLENKWTYGKDRFFPEEDFCRIKSAFKNRKIMPQINIKKARMTNRILNRLYYKVSVFDEILTGWVVKKCSLSKMEAYNLVRSYGDIGIQARFSPHIRGLK